MILSLIFIILFLFNNEFGIYTFENIKSSILQMLSVLPPVMLLLGLMDEWIPREYFMKYMGGRKKEKLGTGSLRELIIFCNRNNR